MWQCYFCGQSSSDASSLSLLDSHVRPILFSAIICSNTSRPISELLPTLLIRQSPDSALLATADHGQDGVPENTVMAQCYRKTGITECSFC